MKPSAMIKYRACLGRIEAHEIARETAKKVFFMDKTNTRESSENKLTTWYSWHDTWEDAHAKLIHDAKRKLASAQGQVTRVTEELGMIVAMKKPGTE